MLHNCNLTCSNHCTHPQYIYLLLSQDLLVLGTSTVDCALTIINRVTRKAKKSNHLPHTFQMDNMEVAIERSAELFNNYFLNIVDNLQI